MIELGLNVRLLGEQMLQLGVFFVAVEDEVDANRRFGFREGVIVLDCLQGITHIYKVQMHVGRGLGHIVECTLLRFL